MFESLPKLKIPKNENLKSRKDHTPFRPSTKDLELREKYQGPLAFQRELAKELAGGGVNEKTDAEVIRGIYERLSTEEKTIQSSANTSTRASQQRLAEVQNTLDYLNIFDKDKGFPEKKYTEEKNKFFGKGTKQVKITYKPEGHLFKKQMVVEGPMSQEMKDYGIRRRMEARIDRTTKPQDDESSTSRTSSESEPTPASTESGQATEHLQALLQELADGNINNDALYDAINRLGIANKEEQGVEKTKDVIEHIKTPFVHAVVEAVLPKADDAFKKQMHQILTQEFEGRQTFGTFFPKINGKSDHGIWHRFLKDLPKIAEHMRLVTGGAKMGRFSPSNLTAPKSWKALGKDTQEFRTMMIMFEQRAKQLARSA